MLLQREGDTSCSCVNEKAPSSSAKGPTQSEVSQSALVTLRRHAWVDGSSFPVPLQKPGTTNTHTHTRRHTYRHSRRHSCRWLSSFAKDYLTCWKKRKTLCSVKWVAVTNCNIVLPFQPLQHIMIWNIIIAWRFLLVHPTFFSFCCSVRAGYILSTYCISVFMTNPLICSLSGDQAVRRGPQANTVSGVLGILAFESGIGSQALWLCQEGVRADLCYMLPIREQITSLGGEREGHRAISGEHCGYFYWDWRSARVYLLAVCSKRCELC